MAVSFDTTVWSCLVVAFWGQGQLGELLPESGSSFSPEYPPLQMDWCNGQVTILQLPWTKTTWSRGALLQVLTQSSRTCPVAALCTYVSSQAAQQRKTHLFAYLDSLEYCCSLLKCAFLAQVNRIWSADGHPCITGHSFCIGGTTELLRWGVPPDITMIIHFLRHKCNTFRSILLDRPSAFLRKSLHCV
jgi:hypothetical protein